MAPKSVMYRLLVNRTSPPLPHFALLLLVSITKYLEEYVTYTVFHSARLNIVYNLKRSVPFLNYFLSWPQLRAQRFLCSVG